MTYLASERSKLILKSSLCLLPQGRCGLYSKCKCQQHPGCFHLNLPLNQSCTLCFFVRQPNRGSLGMFEHWRGSFLPLCSVKFLRWWDIVEKGSPHRLSRKLLPAGHLTNDRIVSQVGCWVVTLLCSTCWCSLTDQADRGFWLTLYNHAIASWKEIKVTTEKEEFVWFVLTFCEQHVRCCNFSSAAPLLSIIPNDLHPTRTELTDNHKLSLCPLCNDSLLVLISCFICRTDARCINRLLRLYTPSRWTLAPLWRDELMSQTN